MDPHSQQRDVHSDELSPVTAASISGLLYDLAKQESTSLTDESQFLTLIAAQLESETRPEIIQQTFEDLCNFLLATDHEEAVLQTLDLARHFPQPALGFIPGAAFHFSKSTPEGSAAMLRFIEATPLGAACLYVPLQILAAAGEETGEETGLQSRANTVSVEALRRMICKPADGAAFGISPKLAARLRRFGDYLAASDVRRAEELQREAEIPPSVTSDIDRIVLRANALAILGWPSAPDDSEWWKNMAFLNLAHSGPGSAGLLHLMEAKLRPSDRTANFRDLALLAIAPDEDRIRGKILHRIFENFTALGDESGPPQGAALMKLVLTLDRARFETPCLRTAERILSQPTDHDRRRRLFTALVDGGAAPTRTLALIERFALAPAKHLAPKLTVFEQLSGLFHLHSLYVRPGGEQLERILVQSRARKILESLALAKDVDPLVVTKVLEIVTVLGTQAARRFNNTAVTERQAVRPGHKFPMEHIETMLWADTLCKKIRGRYRESVDLKAEAEKSIATLERLGLKRARHLFETYHSAF